MSAFDGVGDLNGDLWKWEERIMVFLPSKFMVLKEDRGIEGGRERSRAADKRGARIGVR